MRMRAGHRGFAVVELVVVIMILSILAAFAVPRFASLELESRSAEVEALGASLRSNSALAHALWIAQGKPAAVSIQGQAITLADGYPTVATIDETVESLEGFVYDGSGGAGVFSRTHDGVTPIANCSVSYSPPPADGAAPTITVDTAGC